MSWGKYVENGGFVGWSVGPGTQRVHVNNSEVELTPAELREFLDEGASRLGLTLENPLEVLRDRRGGG